MPILLLSWRRKPLRVVFIGVASLFAALVSGKLLLRYGESENRASRFFVRRHPERWSKSHVH
jgi:hypothetical protein